VVVGVLAHGDGGLGRQQHAVLVLTPDFGKIQSERVFNMRKFHIAEWNNFDV